MDKISTNTKQKIARYSLISLILILFVLMFVPFFAPLLIAALFAFALNDYVGYFTTKGLKKSYATLLITFGALLGVAAPFIFIVLKAVSLVKTFSATGVKDTAIYLATEKLLLNISESVTSLGSRFGLDLSQLPNPTELLSKYSSVIGNFATNILTRIPDLGLALFVFFLGLYFFLTEAQKIKSQIIKWQLLPENETDNLIRIIKNSSRLTLVASVLIGMLQALIISTVAYFCGFSEFFIIFLVTAVCSLLPVVGSAPTPLFLMLVAFVQGNTGAAIAMLVASIVAGAVDNLIKPMVLNSSGDNELHPILSLLTLIGAIIAFGAIGILIGPIITQLALDMLPSLISDEKSGEIQTPEA
jgi:predicted PurR-regulated permease PerM